MSHDDDSIARVEPRSGEVSLIGAPRKLFGIAVCGRSFWVAGFLGSTLQRIDTRSSR